jgi:hypothetical protein
MITYGPGKSIRTSSKTTNSQGEFVFVMKQTNLSKDIVAFKQSYEKIRKAVEPPYQVPLSVVLQSCNANMSDEVLLYY